MRTDFVKASYCRRRIEWAQHLIAYAQKVKGIGPGTFWLDEKLVEKYIKEQEDYIAALENRIKELNSKK